MTHKIGGTQVDDFTYAYIGCALWSSTDNADDSSGEPLDSNYSVDDLSGGTLLQIIEDCSNFQEANETYLNFAGDSEQNGHDFWLTRNGHGAGFWDRGYSQEVADKLSEASRVYGSVDLYIGDDGLIYS